MAFLNGPGSQVLWICQKGVTANISCMLPSIRGQIIQQGDERERDKGYYQVSTICPETEGV